MRSSSFVLSFALTALAVLSASCADLDPCTRGTEGCACRLPERVDLANPACDGAMVCAKDACVVPAEPDGETICYDACAYRQDGVCDDGAAGSKDEFCGLGSDCSDCGLRDNPCFGTASPVFCPQTPTFCWPSITDCNAVRFCGTETTPVGCGTGQAVDCTQPPNGRCVLSAGCSTAAPQRCVEEAVCTASYIDCNSIAACGAIAAVGCYSGETVVCTNGTPSCAP